MFIVWGKRNAGKINKFFFIFADGTIFFSFANLPRFLACCFSGFGVLGLGFSGGVY